MIEHKFKLLLDNTKETIYYERPMFTLDGKQFSCVVSSDYKLSDSSILNVQIGTNTPINMQPMTENFIEQGRTIIKRKYNLLKIINDELFYFLFDDGCIKVGKVIDNKTKIEFKELNIIVPYTKFDSKNNTIEIPVVYYVENGKLSIGEQSFDLVMDKDGVAKYQRLWGDYVCCIIGGKRGQWKRKTRLNFIVSHDVKLPIELMQLAKTQHYIFYNNSKYITKEEWKEIDDSNEHILSSYIYGKVDENNIINIVDNEEEGVIKYYASKDSLDSGDVINIGDFTCQVYTEYVPDKVGTLFFIYIDTDSLNTPITSDYFIAERLNSYDESFYVTELENKKIITVLGCDYEVSEVTMIDFDGWKEAVLVDDSEKVYSVNTDSVTNTLFTLKDDDDKFVLFSTSFNDEELSSLKFDKKIMNKVTVNGVDYFKELNSVVTKIDGNDELHTVDEEVPFYIPIVPKYKLNILNYQLPNFFICQLDLDNLKWMNEMVDEYASMRQDICYNLRDYNISYQPPQFMVDKTDEQVLKRTYNDLFGFDNIDPLPSVNIVKELHDVVINFPMNNIHGTNTFQEIWVNEKFVNSKKEEFINKIVDMEKDIYYPMKYENIYSEDEGEISTNEKLVNVTDIEFYLHFRTRNESWEVTEDYKTTYDDSVIANDNSSGTIDINQSDNDAIVNSNDSNITTIKSSWNVFDYYEKEMPSQEENLKVKAAPIITDNMLINFDTNTIFNSDENKFYQPSDLLSFLNFSDDDVFYQKSKLGKSFLRISFFDSKNPRKQSLLGTSTIFLDSGKLFGTFTNMNSNPSGNLTYLSPKNWKSSSDYISVNREAVMLNNTNISPELSNIDFDENKRLSSKITVSNKNASTSSSEGFYVYIFREYSSHLHERTIYAKIQFNHAGTGQVIDLFQPMKPNYALYDMADKDDRDALKKGINIKDLYDMMYIPINIKYDLDTKKYCWYLPFELSKNNNENKIKFNLYEVKVKNYAPDIQTD